MHGSVAAEDDSNIGARAVVSPRDRLVCLKRTQTRLIYVRSDDSDGAQTAAGYCMGGTVGEIRLVA